MRISFEVRAGLVMRQIHHWTALVFVAAIAIHLARVFFTGAFRRPRELNWVIGVGAAARSRSRTGSPGYSLPDDLLSGTGLRIVYSVVLSVPFIGPWLAFLFFGGEFPAPDLLAALFVLHVLFLPALLIGADRRRTSASCGTRRTRSSAGRGPRRGQRRRAAVLAGAVVPLGSGCSS